MIFEFQASYQKSMDDQRFKEQMFSYLVKAGMSPGDSGDLQSIIGKTMKNVETIMSNEFPEAFTVDPSGNVQMNPNVYQNAEMQARINARYNELVRNATKTLDDAAGQALIDMHSQDPNVMALTKSAYEDVNGRTVVPFFDAVNKVYFRYINGQRIDYSPEEMEMVRKAGK